MQHKKRVQLLKKTELVLENEDPLKRLGELAQKGKYFSNINWDIYANGIMIMCELSFSVNGKKKILSQEATFVETQDIQHAKRCIAALVLENLNLGVEREIGETPEEDEEEIMEEVDERMEDMGTKVVKGLLDHCMTSIADQTKLDVEKVKETMDDVMETDPENFDVGTLLAAVGCILSPLTNNED